jgi:single-strand DNA-binding protein
MAGSINKAMIVGNVGKDPEIRSTSGGARCANLTVATSETWRDKSSGERKEKTEWHRVTVWNERLVEVIEKYVRKGDKVYIEGALETRKWTDNAGVEKYSTEIVLKAFRGELTMLSSPNSGDGGGGGSRRSSGGSRAGDASGYENDDRPAPAAAPRRTNDDLDDEIPF